MDKKKSRFYVSIDLSDAQKVDELMNTIVRDLFGCDVEDVKREVGEEAWVRHRQNLLNAYANR